MDVPFVYQAAEGAPADRAQASGLRGSRPTASALRQSLFVRQAGSGAAISPLDIHQGSIGDCFLLSAIGEIARAAPGRIDAMIQPDGTGADTVTLYEAADGGPVDLDTKTFKPVEIATNDNFAADGVNSATNPTATGGLQEIWPQVIEEAYANLNGGYAAIRNGGYDLVAMETLTGKIARYVPIESAHLNRLKTLGAAALVEFDTPDSTNLGFGLIQDHAYMFEGLVGTGQNTKVQLLNPWGSDEPALIPWANVAQNFVSLTIGHV